MSSASRATIAKLSALCVFVAGCAVTQTIVDKMRVEPLSPTAFHSSLTESTQCTHCHAEVAAAPSVPHPHYKKCASCHRTPE